MMMTDPIGQVSLPPDRAIRGDRVARTRESIIVATLSLAMDGEVAPIVRDIAMLAGVSARTVFQHFADTTELYVAVLNRVLVAMVAELPDPDPTMELDRRIDTMIDNRATHFDKLVSMWPFVQALQQRSTDAAEQLLHMYSASRNGSTSSSRSSPIRHASARSTRSACCWHRKAGSCFATGSASPSRARATNGASWSTAC
jgi:AcrR family transcriptional regulator